MKMASRRRPAILTSTLLATFVHIALTQAASCFYPNYAPAIDYNFVPCGNPNEISPCCVPSEGDVCLSNGLCSWTGHYIYRGGCTDPSWKSEKCPNYCPSIEPSGWIALQPCGETNYCCSNGTACCNEPDRVFSVPKGTVVNNYGASSTTSNPVSTTTTSSSSSTSLPASSSSKSSSPSPTPSPAPSGSKNTLAIGVGVGVGAVVILATAIAVTMLCIKSRRKKATLAHAHAAGQNMYPMQPGYGAQPMMPMAGKQDFAPQPHMQQLSELPPKEDGLKPRPVYEAPA